ncbi:histidine phosphatase family protein [Antribacter gilvus]|uniref:histidine phosphatase family protein n=1 Tax=Antribacter gilvus TaxID=2304675 RepID=UPI000F76EDAD|nr:histidine phosphatase family protein [Antribacter gilvus]
MTLYLVRHGQPVMDPAAPASTWHLDSAHEADVLELATRAPWADDAVWFTSPEPKVARTAFLLAGRGVEVVDDLREHDRGTTTWLPDFPEVMAASFARPGAPARPGWESLDETRARVARAARGILAAHPGRDVVLAGHGTAWTLLAAELTGTAPDVERWRTLPMPAVIRLDLAGDV